MCAFCLSDVSRGREPNRRLAFGGCLQTLALCSVSILAVTLCRFAIYLKTALCRAAPLTSPFVRIPRGPLYNALTANEERSKRLHLRKSNAADIANNRTRRVKCKALAQSTDNNNFPLSLLYLLKTMLYRFVLCIAARFVFFDFFQHAA